MLMKKRYCDGPFGQIHYIAADEGVPLILLHQSPTSSIQFKMVMGPLTERGILPIAMDTPGFGMSDTPDFVPAIEDYSKAVIALMDHLHLDGFHILGHHTGAQTATEVAILEPLRIRSLILNTPFLLSRQESDEMREQIVPFEEQITPKTDGKHLLESWNYRSKFCPGFLPEVMHRHVVQQLVHIDKGWYGHNACFNYKHAEKLKRVSQPTMLLTNTGDFLLEYARRAMEVRPDFHYVELEGGTLDFIDERPEQWSDAVSAFLQGV